VITDRDIREQVARSIDGADESENFDVEAITDEIRSTYGLVDIDAIPAEEYWAIVAKHDRTGA
jgi:hypothetical protein